MEAPTISQLRSGPPTVSLLTAAAAIGIGRTKAYELAKRDEFPVAVTRVGVIYRVPVTDLLRFLHASDGTGSDDAASREHHAGADARVG